MIIFAAFTNSYAATRGFADTVIDYFDSGAGPYGGNSSSFPTPVSTDVVLGDDTGSVVDFLSLPTGSFVTVGFTDETVINGAGDDIFITEIGGAGEAANVFVSSDSVNFTLLGVADNGTTTSFDLSSIGFLTAVTAVKIVGLDSLGDSPGFDVVNVRVLPGSIGPAPVVPIPSAVWLFGTALIGLYKFGCKKSLSA